MSVRCEHCGDSSVARAVGRPRSRYVPRQARALCPLLLTVGMTLALPALTAGTEPPTPAEIRRLVTQLGSDQFAEREAASRRLEAIGEPALPALRKATANQDPEVRRRAGQVIPAIHVRLFGALRQVRRVAWMDTVQNIPAHIYHTTFSPDRRSYLAGGDVGPLRLWDVDSGKLLREFTGHEGWSHCAAFTPDGKQVLSGGTDRALRLWDVATGQQVRTFAGHTAEVRTVAVSPDGRLALSGSGDKTLRLWELATGKELRRLEGHAGWCGGCFSPDGKRVLSFSPDRTVRLWEVATGKSLRVLAPFKDAKPRKGYDLEVRAFFLPGGRQVAGYAWSTDTSLVIWDVDSGREVRRVDLGADHHRDLAASPDGRSFLTGHEDCTVRL